MRELSDIFKALGDETRLSIMALLLEHGELCVCDIEQALDATQSKTSRHLRHLLHAGLVQDRREGVWVHYSLPKHLGETRRAIRRVLKAVLKPELTGKLSARFDRLCCVDGECVPASERAKADAAK